jgi:hypothetical protein
LSADGECGAPVGGGIVGVEKIWGIWGVSIRREGDEEVKAFAKIFKIPRHIESLIICMEH